MLQFRPMSREDAAVIGEIDREAFAADDQYDETFLAAIPTQAHLHAVLAVAQGNTIVAWALIDRASPVTRIRSVSVHTDHQRRGYGSALLRHLITTHRGPFDLLVEDTNAAAIACYRKLGFAFAEPDPLLPERRRMTLAQS